MSEDGNQDQCKDSGAGQNRQAPPRDDGSISFYLGCARLPDAAAQNALTKGDGERPMGSSPASRLIHRSYPAGTTPMLER
jgi:hypothetical protein